MARLTEDDGSDTRWTLFVRSQVPILGTAAILLLVLVSLDVDSPHTELVIIGWAILAVPAAAILVLPWERWPPASQAALGIVDIIGITVLGVAMHGSIDTVAMLAALPAVWMGVVAGWWGAAIGVVGAYVASLVPLLTAHEEPAPASWASALVTPVVISVLVAVTVLLTDRVRRSTAGLRRALDDLSAATARSERIGAVMQSFAEEIDLGMGYIPLDGTEPFFNQPLRDMYALAHVEGNAGSLVFCEDQVTPVPADDQPLARALSGETVTDALVWVGPRGRQRAVVCNGRPLFDTDGTRNGAVIVVQDVTDLLRAERSREDALATLSHELRTPLTSIVGYADLLAGEDIPARARAQLDVITRNAEHLLALTTAFLEGLHRQPDLERRPVGARELIDDALDVLRTTPGFGDRNLRIEVGPDLRVSADRRAMGIVLSNLLNNAVKFSRPGDSIRICAGEDDGLVSLTLHNTGSPIETEDLERIFDRFYRGANAQRDAVQGTGIGLSISREIVVAHGGTLIAEPVDDGACFRVTLPRL